MRRQVLCAWQRSRLPAATQPRPGPVGLLDQAPSASARPLTGGDEGRLSLPMRGGHRPVRGSSVAPAARLEESRLGRGSFQGPSAERPPAVAGARIPGATYCTRPGGRRSAPRVAARRIDAARDGLTLDELLWLISRARFREPCRRNDAQEVPLGNKCLPNRCCCPSVRAVNRWNVLRVQLLGDLLQRHSLPEQRVDLLPPYVVTVVAEFVRKPDVVGG